MLFYFARETAGALGTRHSPRPLFSRVVVGKPRAFSRRENVIGCLKIKSEIQRRRARQAKRDPGPITTSLSCCAKVIEQRLSKDGHGVWVPAFAGTTPGALRGAIQRRSNPSSILRCRAMDCFACARNDGARGEIRRCLKSLCIGNLIAAHPSRRRFAPPQDEVRWLA